jgi:hypothetical protein
MKRQHQRRPSKPIIYLIAEDKTGEQVFRAIIQKRGVNADVRFRGKAEGVVPLAEELKELIDTVLHEKSGKDCIVVLHDTDDSVQTYREHYKQIALICDQYQEHVTRLEAVQEIEAWLLADSGLCKWLNIKPKASDYLKRPSDRLRSLIHERPGSLKWNRNDQPKILQNISATGDEFSESMRIAMKILLQLPCAQ